MIAEQKCEVQVLKKMKQGAKKGTVWCPQCFWELKDVQPPEGETTDEIEEPPPPPPVVKKGGQKDDNSGEDCNELPELPVDLDFESCVMHLKESPKLSPTAAPKGKKGKKAQRGGQLQRELVQALFFEETRAGHNVTEEGEILRDEEPPASAPSREEKRSQTPVSVPLMSPQPVPEWPPRAVREWPPRAEPVAQPQRTSAGAPVKSEVPAGAYPAAGKSSPSSSEKPAEAIKPFTRDPATASKSSQPARSTDLPPGWRSAKDPATGNLYYYHIQTKEVTWDRPADEKSCDNEPDADSILIAGADKPTPASACSQSSQASTSVSQASTACSQASTSASTSAPSRASANVEYVCTHSWIPRDDDRNCIRLTHGERIVLEGETLNGWGFGSVVPESGEARRTGHFPRWAVSTNPAPEPTLFVPGARGVAVEDFSSPAGGYLSIQAGESFVLRYQVEPYVWVWAEDPGDPSRRGWVPEAVIRLT